jgi:hypothetical protein
MAAADKPFRATQAAGAACWDNDGTRNPVACSFFEKADRHFAGVQNDEIGAS